jgi:hypothetical protein
VNHEPVSLFIGWLKTLPGLSAVASRIASQVADDTQLPAIAVVNATGAPIADAGGIDTIYDWTFTVYCIAGKTGVGSDYPDYQTAAQLAGAVVDGCRAVAGGDHYATTAGARLIDLEVVAMTRTVDEGGNAIVTLTVDARVSD